MAWLLRVPLRKEQSASGGQDPRCRHQVSALTFEGKKAVAQIAQQGKTPVPGQLLCPPSFPVENRGSPAASRGWRTRLLIRARVAEKTSSSRSRADSSGLHMASVPAGGPVNGAQIRVRQSWGTRVSARPLRRVPEARSMTPAHIRIEQGAQVASKGSSQTLATDPCPTPRLGPAEAEGSLKERETGLGTAKRSIPFYPKRQRVLRPSSGPLSTPGLIQPPWLPRVQSDISWCASPLSAGSLETRTCRQGSPAVLKAKAQVSVTQ